MQIKRLLQDGEPADRPEKRASTSPPSYSPRSTPALPSSSIAAQYQYFDQLGDTDTDSDTATTPTPAATDDMCIDTPTDDSPPGLDADAPGETDSDEVVTPPDSSRPSKAPRTTIAAVDGTVDPALLARFRTGDAEAPGEAAQTPIPRPRSTLSIRSRPISQVSTISNTVSHVSNNILNAIPLDELSHEERQQVYRDTWFNKDMDLRDFSTPTLCKKYPQFADEILEAFVRLTTFGVEVWTNYDAHLGKFYYDGERLQDCGKLCLSPRERAKLSPEFKFQNICLKINTPFSALYWITFHIMEEADYVATKPCVYSDHNPQLEALVRDLEDGVEAESALWLGMRGFSLEDLDWIAKCAVRKGG